jgi:hypothetical protein
MAQITAARSRYGTYGTIAVRCRYRSGSGSTLFTVDGKVELTVAEARELADQLNALAGRAERDLKDYKERREKKLRRWGAEIARGSKGNGVSHEQER